MDCSGYFSAQSLNLRPGTANYRLEHCFSLSVYMFFLCLPVELTLINCNWSLLKLWLAEQRRHFLSAFPKFIVNASKESDMQGVSAFTRSRSTAISVVSSYRGRENVIQNHVYETEKCSMGIYFMNSFFFMWTYFYIHSAHRASLLQYYNIYSITWSVD